MEQNVGTTERAIRLFAAVALICIALFVPMSYYFQIALYVAAAIAVVTAAVGFCPIWSLLGINTCGRR